MKPKSVPEATDRAAKTRARILDIALREFAEFGLAGARTEQISKAAKVNKALLYYYFKSKEDLYMATLDMAAVRVRDSTFAELAREGSAGERVLRAALNHFDRILGHREFQSLMQQEMTRFHQGESSAVNLIVEKVFEPVLVLYRSMLSEGIKTGELINVDWMQIQCAALGANAFYFMSAPVWKLLIKEDPLTRKALINRRRLLLEFLGQALFIDRKHGKELAAKVYADTPMPQVGKDGFKFGRKA